MPTTLTISETTAETILPLRAAVLRPGHPLEDAVFPTDAAPGTFHLAAYDGEKLVGCASVHVAPTPDGRSPAMQLRGMAVLEEYRSQGVGARVLEVLERMALERGAAVIWCNGREQAGGFYRRHGWVQQGDMFMSVGVPHYVFAKPLA
jgi:GNAT superfamily N-acetyltransferase